MKKKLVAIVVVVTIALVLSAAGCTAPDKTPEVIPNDKAPEILNDENVSEEDIAGIPNEQEAAIEEYTGEGMTFEEFCVGMKDDLSPELLEEVRDLYERWIEAENDGDPKRMADKMTEIYEELIDLDVLTMEEQPSMIMAGPRPKN